MVLFFYAFLSGRETVKAYGLSCSNHYLCHVEEMNVKWVFLFFGILERPIKRLRGVIYTPSPGLSLVTLTGQPFAPWVPVVPV